MNLIHICKQYHHNHTTKAQSFNKALISASISLQIDSSKLFQLIRVHSTHTQNRKIDTIQQLK